MKATWKGAVLAESDDTVVVEGNHYFPPGSVNQQYMTEAEHHTTCPWKGLASYYSIVVDGEENTHAAWYYPNPSDAAQHIKGHVAFWKGVKIEE